MEENKKEVLFQAIDNFKETHDETYFGMIYELIFGELTAHVTTYTKTLKKDKGFCEADIIEVVQLTMVKIWKGLDKIEDNRTFFKWMNVTADHTCLDYWKKAANKYEITESYFRPEKQSDEEGETYSIFDQFDENEELNALNMSEITDIVSTCVEALDESTQDLIQMRFFDELGYSDISKVTGLAEGTIRSRISRAKVKLGDAVKEEFRKRGLRFGFGSEEKDIYAFA